MVCALRRLLRWLPVAAVSLVAVPSAAEPQPEWAPTPAPRDALELTVSAGYARTPTGYGGTSSSGPGEGIASEVGLGVRTTPRWSVAIVGQYGELARERGDRVQTGRAGLTVAYHVLPEGRLDPWFGVGTGYRFAHTDGASLHGFEIARIIAGADVRASPPLAVGPLVSVGLDVFPWHASAPRWYVVGCVGIQGRFDLSPTIVGD